MAKGNRISMLRRELNLNQRDLAERLGVGQTTVSAWETGKTEPDSQMMGKMALLFDAPVGYLMGLESLTPSQRDERYYAAHERQEQERREREIEETAQSLASGLTLDEEAEIIRKEYLDAWEKKETAETFEGFMAMKIVDSQTQAQRERLVKMLEQIATIFRP